MSSGSYGHKVLVESDSRSSFRRRLFLNRKCLVRTTSRRLDSSSLKVFVERGTTESLFYVGLERGLERNPVLITRTYSSLVPSEKLLRPFLKSLPVRLRRRSRVSVDLVYLGFSAGLHTGSMRVSISGGVKRESYREVRLVKSLGCGMCESSDWKGKVRILFRFVSVKYEKKRNREVMSRLK